MRDPNNAEVNARLAWLAGWKKIKDGSGLYWRRGKRFWKPDPPNYCSSLDLLQRDVLGLLTREQWKQFVDLPDWTPKNSDATGAEYYLTMPADVIARAALKALEGDNHD